MPLLEDKKYVQLLSLICFIQQAQEVHAEVVQDPLLRVQRPHPDRLQERRGGTEVRRVGVPGE